MTNNASSLPSVLGQLGIARDRGSGRPLVGAGAQVLVDGAPHSLGHLDGRSPNTRRSQFPGRSGRRPCPLHYRSEMLGGQRHSSKLVPSQLTAALGPGCGPPAFRLLPAASSDFDPTAGDDLRGSVDVASCSAALAQGSVQPTDRPALLADEAVDLPDLLQDLRVGSGVRASPWPRPRAWRCG